MTRHQSYRLLVAQAEHQGFLFELFCQTSGKPFHDVGLPQALLSTLLKQQFDAKELAYRNEFPDASHSVIERDGCPVGQVRVNSTPESVHIVDISIQPSSQRQGIATAVIGGILDATTADHRPVYLMVKNDSSAEKLYQTLGFRVIERGEVYSRMVLRVK